MWLEFHLNGQKKRLEVEPGATLAQALERLGEAVTSEVSIDGRVLEASLTLAYRVQDCSVNTVDVVVEPAVDALVMDQLATAH